MGIGLEVSADVEIHSNGEAKVTKILTDLFFVPELASSSSAGQPAEKRNVRLFRMELEFRKLHRSPFISADAGEELSDLIYAAHLLQQTHSLKQILLKDGKTMIAIFPCRGWPARPNMKC